MWLAALWMLGCTTPCEMSGQTNLNRVERAIDAFREQNDRLPGSLDELQQAQKPGKELTLVYSTDGGRVWSIAYQRSGDDYALRFHHVHCFVGHENGKTTSSGCDPFK